MFFAEYPWSTYTETSDLSSFSSSKSAFDLITRNYLSPMRAGSSTLLITFELSHRTGVVENFSPAEGTGGGSFAQDISEIEFSNDRTN